MKSVEIFKERHYKIEKCYIIKENVKTKITILLNFYRELNFNFSLSLKIYIDSLTFLNAINFYFKVFYKKNINVLENFSVS